MHDTLPLLLDTDFPRITRKQLETLQVNLGYRCNQQCFHCHVNASPKRKEIMDLETAELVVEFVRASGVSTLDLTGGAPEMNPHFRYLVESASNLGVKIIDRCNLTILEEPGYEDLAQFLAAHRAEIVASLPCYLEENVDAQRGEGVFDTSLKALHRLNRLGYGCPDSGLILNLVYNPQGATLPPPQVELENAYKLELKSRYGIMFNRLYTLANMPIRRFGSTLITQGRFDGYMTLLRNSHNSKNLEEVMCRSLISVDWQGYVYDCDFNQMLGLSLGAGVRLRIHLREALLLSWKGQPITVADHCYGCTAGAGSSCGGALRS
ncbi:arsenosugar biosynthesis radical SAM (seleno)protein ArsS [Methylocaldum sp.]|uniref:arsenosugar biosynthesis radical SAM (seleno)protein ArsS n=1 Tax=Methylocaldum sp. TaxID=1969727 RepID=UPI002D56913B|nr:arsenosugar biosynthesis radical SAM (seleno)protein ArsS [Methylocaldum sp.]HYE37708.1 arsenosugar biosynthesis radical SAM (seleno)protein ArsS [Methylocaldum sp.]